jgi:hypothetical protein
MWVKGEMGAYGVGGGEEVVEGEVVLEELEEGLGEDEAGVVRFSAGGDHLDAVLEGDDGHEAEGEQHHQRVRARDAPRLRRAPREDRRRPQPVLAPRAPLRRPHGVLWRGDPRLGTRPLHWPLTHPGAPLPSHSKTRRNGRSPSLKLQQPEPQLPLGTHHSLRPKLSVNPEPAHKPTDVRTNTPTSNLLLLSTMIQNGSYLIRKHRKMGARIFLTRQCRGGDVDRVVAELFKSGTKLIAVEFSHPRVWHRTGDSSKKR